MDLFSALGFGIFGIPIDYPDTYTQCTLIMTEEPDPVISSDLTTEECDPEFL
jgi:hypothetical protein